MDTRRELARVFKNLLEALLIAEITIEKANTVRIALRDLDDSEERKEGDFNT